MIRSRLLLLVPEIVLCVVGITLGLYACGGGGGSSSSSPAPNAAVSKFPVHIDPSNRYLVDATGKPFLLHGESAFSLISQATDAEVDQYLADRQQKGFNTIWVGLIDHKFADKAPSNISGTPPFDGVVPSTSFSDFSKPDEAYFAHADSVIQKAADKGFLVLLSPAYLGYNGGYGGETEGWYQDLLANDAADPMGRLHDFGRYLGQRYARFSNILWLNGGDYDPLSPPDPPIVRKIALGIREVDTHSLHSGHCAQELSAFQCWGGETWLQINDTYTYTDVYQTARTEYQRVPSMPVFLVEGRYENEDILNGNGTEQQVRVQAYQALLSGEMGQVFGNNPIWSFSSKIAIYPSTPPDWTAWLNSPGSLSMVHVHSLFAPRAWWTLQPDFSNTLLTGGQAGSGVPYDRAVAAKAADGSFAIAYMPSSRQITVDLGQLAGPNVNARWYDPAAGTFTGLITGASIPTSSGSTLFNPPGNNGSTSGTYSDWVLLLESTP
jgi:hypothetical protein